MYHNSIDPEAAVSQGNWNKAVYINQCFESYFTVFGLSYIVICIVAVIFQTFTRFCKAVGKGLIVSRTVEKS